MKNLSKLDKQKPDKLEQLKEKKIKTWRAPLFVFQEVLKFKTNRSLDWVAADHQVEENIFIKEQQTHCQTIFPFFWSCLNINRLLIELLLLLEF